MPKATDIIAAHLGSAKFALQQQATFGYVADMRLPHRQRPNGCLVRVRVAVGPDRMVCRVTNTGKDHAAFRDAATPFLAFATAQMSGWRAEPGSSGTGGGRVFYAGMTYYPPSLPSTHLAFVDLLQAVSSARAACVNRSKYRKQGRERWPCQGMDSGVYPVEWTVEGAGVYVTVRIGNKGRDSDAFWDLARWVLDYVKRHNPDGRDCSPQPRGIGLKIFSDVLRLEVPCL